MESGTQARALFSFDLVPNILEGLDPKRGEMKLGSKSLSLIASITVWLKLQLTPENPSWHFNSIYFHIHVVAHCCLSNTFLCGRWSWASGPAAETSGAWHTGHGAQDESVTNVLAAHPEVWHQLLQHGDQHARGMPGLGGQCESLGLRCHFLSYLFVYILLLDICFIMFSYVLFSIWGDCPNQKDPKRTAAMDRISTRI